jgi:hypothetical protein
MEMARRCKKESSTDGDTKGRKRKLSNSSALPVVSTSVSSPVLSSILFSSSHVSPSLQSRCTIQQQGQQSPNCTLSELLRTEYDSASNDCFDSNMNDFNVDDGRCSSNSSITSTMSKKQRQQQYYQQQQKTQCNNKNNHHHHSALPSSSAPDVAIVSPLSSPKDKQRSKKRVHFSITEPQTIPRSAYDNNSNDQGYFKHCWYTVSFCWHIPGIFVLSL